MPVFQVDVEKCKRDGICSKLCPVMVIVNDDAGVPFLVDGGEKRCIGCGQCLVFCPHGAVSLDGLPLESIEKIDRNIFPSVESLNELMKSRRSIRAFSKKPIPDDELKKVVHMAAYAPTAKNQRKLRWIIINDYEKIKQLINAVADWMDEFAGSKPVTPLQRSSKILVTMVRKGKDPIFRGAKQIAVCVAQNDVWGKSDAVISLSYFELAAHAMGIGCCWAGYFTSASEHSSKIRTLLQLEPDEVVGGAQMLGYPSIKAQCTPPRKEVRLDWM